MDAILNVSSKWVYVLALISLANFFFGFVVLFFERKKPTSTLAWLMVLYFVPVLGFILYITLSQNIARRKIFRLSPSEERNINEALTAQKDDMENGRFEYVDELCIKWYDLIRLNQNYAWAYLTEDNKVELLTDGAEKFRRLQEDMLAAKESINIEYFILRPDKLGLGIIDILTRKAMEGLQVRLLLDAMGSRHVKPRHLRTLRKAGGKVAFFFKPKIFRADFNLNYRNHRKIVVIDNEIGYVGGFNIGREYIGESKKFGGWRDTHLRMEGGAVADLFDRFVLDWRFASGEKMPLKRPKLRYIDEPGSAAVQIVSSGPDSHREEVKLAYLKMISSAKQSIRIQTPYFIPDDSIMEGLRSAAMSGVDVRIMIPNQPDHMFVYWVTCQNAASLLEYGVKVYIYNEGFLHAKTVAVDGEVCSVGSANFDNRSFSLNFECNAIVYNEEFTKCQEDAFDEDIKDSFQLTERIYRSRSLVVKIKESVGRLLSGIL